MASSFLRRDYTGPTVDRRRLEAHEEVDLAREIKAGADADERLEAGQGRPGDEMVAARGRRAHQRFVTANVGLVIDAATRMAVPPHVDLQDVIQDGMLGLDRAVRDFDPDRGFRFSTYAVWWIRRAMQVGLESTTASVRLPFNRMREVRSHREAFESGTAAVMNPLDVRADSMLRMASLDAPAGVDRGSRLGDTVQADRSCPQVAIDAQVDRQAVAVLLETLDDDNAQLVAARYGLDGSEPRSFVDLAQERGVTAEAVRRRVVRSLARMRPHAERLTAV